MVYSWWFTGNVYWWIICKLLISIFTKAGANTSARFDFHYEIRSVFHTYTLIKNIILNTSYHYMIS